MKKSWRALPMLLLCLAACGQPDSRSSPATLPSVDPNAVLMEDDLYRVTLADGWRLVEEDNTVTAYAADNSAALNISYEDNLSGQTLDSYATYTVDTVGQASGVHDIELALNERVNTYTAAKLTYRSSPGHLVQYLIGDGDRFFIISCMDNDNKHAAALQAMLDGFTLKK